MFDAELERRYTRRARTNEALIGHASLVPNALASEQNLLNTFLFDAGWKGVWSSPKVAFEGSEGRPLTPFLWFRMVAEGQVPEPVDEIRLKHIGKRSTKWGEHEVYEIAAGGVVLPFPASGSESGLRRQTVMELGPLGRFQNPVIDEGTIGAYGSERGTMVVERVQGDARDYKVATVGLPKELEWRSVLDEKTRLLDSLTAEEKGFFASQSAVLEMLGKQQSEPLKDVAEGDVRIDNEAGGKPAFVESWPGRLSLVTYSDRRLRDDVLRLGKAANPQLIAEMIKSQGGAGLKLDVTLEYGELKARLHEMHRKNTTFVGSKGVNPERIIAVFDGVYPVEEPEFQSTTWSSASSDSLDPIGRFTPSAEQKALLDSIKSIERRRSRYSWRQGH